MAPEDDQERAWPAGSVIMIIVLLNVAEMHTTPCGTTRFSRFFLNSFLRLADLVAAAAAPVCSCGSFATFHPIRFPGESPGRFFTCESRSSSRPRRPCAGPCGYAHWCACVVRAPANCGDDGFRGSTEFQSAAGCSFELPCGDRLRRGLLIRWP